MDLYIKLFLVKSTKYDYRRDVKDKCMIQERLKDVIIAAYMSY